MSDHASRSPSGAYWWGNCPGGPAYVEKLGIVKESGAAAEWGTKCHELAAPAILYALDTAHKLELPADDPEDPEDPEVKEMVRKYLDLLFTFEPLCDCPPTTWRYGVEAKVSHFRFPNGGGTVDFWATCDVHKWLRIVDLKTGHGEVEAEGNPQCGLYATQLFLSGVTPGVKKIVLEIIQPRSPSGRKVKRWTISPFRLHEFAAVWERKLLASLSPDAPLVAGEKQCKYCPAAPVCPERARMRDSVRSLMRSGPPEGYTPEQIGEALRWIPQLKDWMNSVESFAYQVANNGVQIPGKKLVQKRDGNREWIDPKETIQTLKELGAGPYELMTEPKLLGPAQLEKKFGKKVIDALCKREPGGTVLVDESDERPAIVMDKLSTLRHLIQSKG